MNKLTEKMKRGLSNGRGKELLLIGLLSIALFYAAWTVFQGDSKEEKEALALSENEVKVMRLLKEIDGVGEASVIVCEDEDGVKSVVVVCEGANNLRVAMNVREAVAAAMDTPQKAIKIYLKKV